MFEHLRSLAVFAKVADLGSFRAAARALALSPSVVSHHVSALESRLSLPLLYRSTRRLALTPDGQNLALAAREMVQAAERGIDALSGGSTPSGTLRLTAPAFLATTSLCQDIAAFSREHPNVRLSVSFTDEPRDLLRDGLDLALRIGRLVDSTHKTRKLADMRRLLVSSPRYLASQKPARTPRDLQTWEYIQLSTRPAELVLSSGDKKRTIAFQPKVLVDSAAAIRELVLAGSGIAALPDVLIRAELSRKELVRVLPKWNVTTLGVYTVWPHNAQRAGLTLRFVDFIAPRATALFSAQHLER